MFVTLEGIDRCGKSTQAGLLAEALGDAMLVREPGGTEMGERARAMLKDPDLELDPTAELLLFCAARAELCARVIAPAIAVGTDVVCDRFIDSTAAYQGAGRGLGIELVEGLNAVAIGETVPDLTLLLRIEPDEAEHRGQLRLAAGGADGADRFEAEGTDFQRRVAGAYEELASRHRDRIVVIEAAGEPDEVHARIMAAVDERRGGAGVSPIAADVPATIGEATAHQPAAGLALSAALASPTHAFVFTGPPGTGKRAAARAFAAELLADGAPDPADARRRALAEPSPHPDLVWLEPPGAQHLVETVRERVIGAAAYRPFEGERRVFVIAAAEAMAEESQNALLKTLEEPAPFAHLILITTEPEALLETVRSRCRAVRFAPLAPAVAAELLAERAPASSEPERAAAARLAGGDVGRAALLCSPLGRELRDVVVASGRAARAGALGDRPWERLLTVAEEAGNDAGAAALAAAKALAEEAGESEGPAARRRAREGEEAARRATRRGRTETLDLGLELLAAWLRDLAAVAEGAPDLVLNSDRAEPLAEDAEGLDGRRARRAAELVMDTRRRLTVNVNEDLALEALLYRLEALLATR